VVRRSLVTACLIASFVISPVQAAQRTGRDVVPSVVSPVGLSGAAAIPRKPETIQPKRTSAGVAASVVASCESASQTPLLEGAPANRSIDEGEVDCFEISVPAQTPLLAVSLRGPSDADLDLYLRYAAPPSASAYDCRPFTGSSAEDCSVAKPKRGQWFAMVHAFEGAGSFALSVAFSLCPRSPLGADISGSATRVGLTCHEVTVPAGAAALIVTLTGPTDVDLDLFVRRDTPPTFTSFDCRPYVSGSQETCRFASPAAGEWFIGVNGFDGPGNYTVRAEVRDTVCDVLDTGVPVAAVTSFYECYQIDAAEAELVRGRLTADELAIIGLSRSPDPYQEWDCGAIAFPEDDAFCFAPNDSADTYYIYVASYWGVPVTFSMTTTTSRATAATAGTPVTGHLDGFLDAALLRFDDLADVHAAVGVVGAIGVGLRVARGGAPTWERTVCSPGYPGPVEACQVSPEPGSLYVLVWANDRPVGDFVVLGDRMPT
jgi:hypothetical protein